MEDRQRQILEQVISQFIKTSAPVGSKSLDFQVSSATIRNDMAALEKKGFLKKPHTSGGRIPTAKAYRLFVNDFLHANVMLMKSVAADLESHLAKAQLDEILEKAVFDLADQTGFLAFALLPSGQTFFLGLSNLLREPEFQNPLQISAIIDLIEHRDKFCTFLNSLEIDNQLKVFIGAENILSFLDATSLIVTEWTKSGQQGQIGILGPMRMNYPQILLALKTTLEKFGLVQNPIELPAARGFFLE